MESLACKKPDDNNDKLAEKHEGKQRQRQGQQTFGRGLKIDTGFDPHLRHGAILVHLSPQSARRSPEHSTARDQGRGHA